MILLFYCIIDYYIIIDDADIIDCIIDYALLMIIDAAFNITPLLSPMPRFLSFSLLLMIIFFLSYFDY